MMLYQNRANEQATSELLAEIERVLQYRAARLEEHERIIPARDEAIKWLKGEVENYQRAILDYLVQGQPRIDLPLDLDGTAFQQRVWAALREIPRGETRSYTQVAAAIGVTDTPARAPKKVKIPRLAKKKDRTRLPRKEKKAKQKTAAKKAS